MRSARVCLSAPQVYPRHKGREGKICQTPTIPRTTGMKIKRASRCALDKPPGQAVGGRTPNELPSSLASPPFVAEDAARRFVVDKMSRM